MEKNDAHNLLIELQKVIQGLSDEYDRTFTWLMTKLPLTPAGDHEIGRQLMNIHTKIEELLKRVDEILRQLHG